MAMKSKKKPAAKKPARRAAKKKPTASIVIERQPLVMAGPDLDMMDAGLDLLATVELALSSREAFSDRDEAMVLRGALLQAMKLIRPVRDKINELRV